MKRITPFYLASKIQLSFGQSSYFNQKCDYTILLLRWWLVVVVLATLNLFLDVTPCPLLEYVICG